MHETAQAAISRLARFIMTEISDEAVIESEGAVDSAIRIMRTALDLPMDPKEKESKNEK